jgi:exodeoxyribonuclease VII small subunit
MAKQRLSFEKSLGTLEKIVEELESGSLTLDEALERYERGVAAHKECTDILSAAEKRIEVLLKREDGTFDTKPLQEAGEESKNDE